MTPLKYIHSVRNILYVPNVIKREQIRVLIRPFIIFCVCLLQSSSPDRPDSSAAGQSSHLHINMETEIRTAFKLFVIIMFGFLEFIQSPFFQKQHKQSSVCMIFYWLIDIGMSAAKPTSSENRSQSDPGSPEKTPPRAETKPEVATRLRVASSSSSPGGATTPKPPVPQAAKPALAARPTIPQKPRTTSSSRSIGRITAP